MPSNLSPLRSLPSVEKLAASPLLAAIPAAARTIAAREAISEARATLVQAGEDAESIAFETLAERATTLAQLALMPTLRRAINATGIVLHTNLGRATLAPSAADAVQAVALGHAGLEVDEETGGRGSRQAHTSRLLCELTGAEDAFVVNNNAAATFLAVAGLAPGRDVILSRGQSVEIGGQFRLPDVIESAGAILREVGTTNRTRIGDYERALGPNTGMLLRVHPSNFRVVGFTEETPLADLVALGRTYEILVGDDIGSGALLDLSPWGLTGEPVASDSVRQGADLVWFSGDKLLGGPQAGILVGTRAAIAPLKKHPLARALRPDKMTLAALEATLRLYTTGRALTNVPTLRRIARSPEDVLAACGRLARHIRASLPDADVDIIATVSEVGGGSLPGHTLPSWAVAIAADDISTLARKLRHAPAPVYGRIERNRLLLDLRCVDADEEERLADSFAMVEP